MNTDIITDEIFEPQSSDLSDKSHRQIEMSRRSFVQLLGAGLLITVTQGVSLGQPSRSRDRKARTVAARLHINNDGTITVMTGKVEEGQGARAQLTQAAAEELHVTANHIRLVMADTELVPDDGITAGSRTTPRTVPAVRRGAAAARELLTNLAAEKWNVDTNSLHVRNATITNPATKQTISYADLAKSDLLTAAFANEIPDDVTVVPVEQWKVLGTTVTRPNWHDLVTGAHRYPSDIVRPNMLYAKILRPPSYGATLESIDLTKAKEMKDVVTVHDGQFVGFAAPSTFRAEQALKAAAETASWKTVPNISGKDLFTHLKSNARSGGRSRSNAKGSVDKALTEAAKVLTAEYEIAYVQHAPMEPRAAVAEWKDSKLTVWAGIDWPQRIQRNLAETFSIDTDHVRVIVPDMGGGFGGKHTGEAAEEAARLARVAKRPVSLRWTRAEEFTWAYFRPAGVIQVRAGLSSNGSLTAWDFTNINSGGSAIGPPYEIPNVKTQYLRSDSPLRQGAYRCLAATANNFARESFMDELAAAAGTDPLDFRLARLENPRLRTVLETAARYFDWPKRRKNITPERSVGLACGTEKNSVVAACVEVAIDRKRGEIKVLHVCEAFECGPIQNPDNLLSQVQGCIMMGLGPALREEMRFEDGKVLNAGFAGYRVPRFRDVPKIDVHLVNNTDIPSAGGGETPIIAIAPAIANAIFAATGLRIRSMPIRSDLLKQT